MSIQTVCQRLTTTVLPIVALLLMLLLGVLWPSTAHAQDAGSDFVEDQVIVKIDPRSDATIDQINGEYRTEVEKQLLVNCSTCAKIYLLKILDGVSPPEKAEDMMNDQQNRISYAEPNFTTEAPEGDLRHRARAGGVPAPSPDPAPYSDQYAIEALNLSDAHGISRGRGAVVAVLDTGVQLDHPELADNLTAARYDFVDDDSVPADEANGLDDDGDIFVDEMTGHGTHVAGIVHLTAPETKIMPLRVLDSDGTGNVFLIAEAVQYAVRDGADVINLSLGSRRESELLDDVIEDLEADDDDDDDDEALVGVPPEGVVVVGASGNEDTDTPQYPAAEEGAIAVAAVDEQEKKSEFSNYDTTGEEKWIDISAPGEEIYSTFPLGLYASWSGTSMATPFVAGQAALIRSVRPTLPSGSDEDDDEGQQQLSVERVIKDTARSLDAKNPDYSGKLGAGHADAGASMRSLNTASTNTASTNTASTNTASTNTASTNTAPVISAMSPKPDSKTKLRRPTISATVRDAQTDLAGSSISLYVDGRRKTAFSYNSGTDRLRYASPRLSYAWHRVAIVATDPQGARHIVGWRFRVVR